MTDRTRSGGRDRRPEAAGSFEGWVYCLDSGRLQPAGEGHYVFRTGFRTCGGVVYPVAVRRRSLRGPHLILSS
ncbi:hypothetical protein ACTHPH_21295 [Paenibacillus pasadenensis]|uniref:Uncharacterized protein n=1 Tax=Paenibacillus pasadenensis TaxID=217090 RepID=A0A2N5MZX2_9BACL|nr:MULTISPECIES: hypothetical protein [Paenibacillus]PLT43626.1 hypothetical protein B8V81_2057 [Paenibacillus pasadenensis]QGG54261.1 hypothetical protein GE073_00640 [Paenibacillus sp. B01]